jgi:hypothetical protein
VKVLLEENLDHRLRTVLGPHEVFTVTEQGIDVFVTGDQSLADEQNLAYDDWRSWHCHR